MSCYSLWLYYNDTKTEILWSPLFGSFIEVLKFIVFFPFAITTTQVDCKGFDQGGDVAHCSSRPLATLHSQAKNQISERWLFLKLQFQWHKSKLVGKLYAPMQTAFRVETDQLELILSSGLGIPGHISFWLGNLGHQLFLWNIIKQKGIWNQVLLSPLEK